MSPSEIQDTGKLNVAYFRFDINDATGDLDANRPVPFRLTPNISEFLTTIGVSGPLTASMIAVARCFAQPNFKVGHEVALWEAQTGVLGARLGPQELLTC